ncbi:MAG: Ig-like domain-containing protein, partial [Gemmatimonadaceae bacterium]
VARDASNNILPLTGRTLAWNSSDAGVATVSPAGLITTVAPGTATIEVTVDGVGPAKFTLDVAAAAVGSVDVTPPTKGLIEGDVSSFSATPRDAAGRPLNRPVAWSLDNAKASLSSPTGALTDVTALDSGTVLLTATSQAMTGTSTITITLVPIDSIESIPPRAAPTIQLGAGGGNSSNEKFRVVTATGKATGRLFTVSSSDSSVATVAPVGTPLTDSAGKGEFLVTSASSAASGQTATITVTVDGKSTVWMLTIS